MSDVYSEYKSTYWTINYPSHWIVRKHKEGFSFYSENGVGALQISAYSKDDEVTERDLIEFAKEEVPEGEDLSKAAIGKYSGIESDFKLADHYWRMWFLRKNQVMLFMTYNCEFEVKNEEREIIDQIVSTLK